MALQQVMIKIKIADREYPIRVEAHEEAVVREAGRLLNESVNAYKERFKIHDKQDLLAMVAFDTVIDKLLTEQRFTQQEQSLSQDISHLDKVLTDALKP
jgi:cell division protein ZapA